MNFELLGSKKDNYKFNEITSLSGVKPYVLRFWESEFEQINPVMSEAGHKVYSDLDLENIQKIKDLLFEKKLSIPEAKASLAKEQEELVSLAHLAGSSEKASNEEVLYTGVASKNSSLDLMRNALEVDINKQKEFISQKQFNDGDVLNLVQAKKKLTSVLNKINSLVNEKNW